MEALQDKLKNFEELVMQDASDQKQELITILEQKKREQIDKCELELLKHARDYIRSKILDIEKFKNERLVKNRLKHKEELVETRTRLINEMFSRIRKRIEDFVINESVYNSWFINRLEKVMHDLNMKSAKIIVRELENKNLITELESRNLQIEYTDQNIIGGFKLIDESQNISMDKTLITEIKSAQEDFLINNSQLEIE